MLAHCSPVQQWRVAAQDAESLLVRGSVARRKDDADEEPTNDEKMIALLEQIANK